MDLQAQDRAHRIGQTKEVHIYRLISTNTVEENIYRKSLQKKALNAAVIGDGDFTTQKLEVLDPRELLGISDKNNENDDDNDEKMSPSSSEAAPKPRLPQSEGELRAAMAAAEDEDDRVASAHLVDEQKRLKAEEISDFGTSGGNGIISSSGSSILNIKKKGAAGDEGDLSAQRYTQQMEAALSPLARFALNYNRHWSAFQLASAPLSTLGNSEHSSSSSHYSSHDAQASSDHNAHHNGSDGSDSDSDADDENSEYDDEDEDDESEASSVGGGGRSRSSRSRSALRPPPSPSQSPIPYVRGRAGGGRRRGSGAMAIRVTEEPDIVEIRSARKRRSTSSRRR